MTVPTPASTWQGVAGCPIGDELLDWPPDVFAFANVILERSEAFRFAVSPIDEWPPRGCPDWPGTVHETALAWSEWAEDRQGPLPDLPLELWRVVRQRAELPLEDLAEGRDVRFSDALLTLHAIADEACAGLGVALDTSDAVASVYRARGRELLVRTGSMARLDRRLLRVLPKVRTPPTGRPSFSRYACVVGPGIDARWHKVPARHRGTDPTSEYARLLLLPWPLRVRESDFRRREGSVERLAKDPFGFFDFAPPEGLDLDLLDRVLASARKDAGEVDVVCMPESAVCEDELDDVEALLDRHGVSFVQAGVRQREPEQGRFPGNWLHLGVNPGLEKGALPAKAGGSPWFHLRQNKHHRWSLDEAQIYQYNLGGVLHPHIRWWEAMEVPRRSVQFVEVAELTLVGLVCEDLAQNDGIAALLRSVGPTIVMNVLLDGPQMRSRWAARYASVLADDPGSAVLTLTSYGMVERCRPLGRDVTPIVALWKDPARGIREISLEPGAQAVLLTVSMARTTRRSADGRWPVDNGTHCFDVAAQQVRASDEASGEAPPPWRTRAERPLELEELTILTAWAEAVAEALAYAPERVAEVLTEASSGASWRAAMMLAEPPSRLGDAIDSLGRTVLGEADSHGPPTLDSVLAAAGREVHGERPLDLMVRRALLSMLEERQTRHPQTADDQSPSSPRPRPRPVGRREALSGS